MTWHVSPEEWLLDFTSVPHGRVRGGESLDPIDDRLRKLLAPPPPKVGLIMPSITAARGPAARPGAPEPGRGREASQPVLQVRPNEGAGTEPAGTDDPQAGPRVGASVLDVELISLTPVPKASAADLVMPSLTRPASEADDADDADDDEARVDEDDEEALDRLNPMSGPELGIPADDADDLMSAMASAAPMMAPTPSSAPEADDVIEEPEEVEGELEAEAIDDEPEPEPEVAADAADEPPLIAEPALTANLPIDEWPTLVNMERPTADKPASVSAERSAPVPVERPTSAPVSVERPTSRASERGQAHAAAAASGRRQAAAGAERRQGRGRPASGRQAEPATTAREARDPATADQGRPTAAEQGRAAAAGRRVDRTA